MTLQTFQTARLLLRQPSLDDAADMARELDNINVSKWLTVIPHPYAISDAQWYINEIAQGRARSWSIWADGKLVGSVGLGPTLGFWLSESAWGHGYATEAATVIRDHHFHASTAASLCSEYFVGNNGSCNVLTKIGFMPTGQHETTCRALGAQVQSMTMELTRNRWETLRTSAQ